MSRVTARPRQGMRQYHGAGGAPPAPWSRGPLRRESPVGVVASWFRQEMDAGREVPLERGAALITRVAAGHADALAGRYFSVYDDLDELVARAATIRRDDLYTLRLREGQAVDS